MQALSDETIVQQILDGNTNAFAVLMQRHNPRLYRIARGIVCDDDESEDVMQQTYIAAFFCLSQFRGEGHFAAWLTRIAVREALARLRKARPLSLNEDTTPAACRSPEEQTSDRELVHEAERAIETLSPELRLVFVLRELEQSSTEEVARVLEISEELVRVRLHRARVQLQKHLGHTLERTYAFHLLRCQRVVAGVFRALSL